MPKALGVGVNVATVVQQTYCCYETGGWQQLTNYEDPNNKSGVLGGDNCNIVKRIII